MRKGGERGEVKGEKRKERIEGKEGTFHQCATRQRASAPEQLSRASPVKGKKRKGVAAQSSVKETWQSGNVAVC